MNSKVALGWCGFLALGFCLPAVAASGDSDERVDRRIRELLRQAERFEVTLNIRDIFTIQVPKKPKIVLPPVPPPFSPTSATQPDPVPDLLKTLMAHRQKAYANLLARDFAGAFEQAERGLRVIDTGTFGSSPEPKVVTIENRLHRIRVTAERLGHRERAEKGFAQLGLQVQALIHSQAQGLLLVNGNVLREGGRIRGAQVTHIGPHSAVFLYDDIHIRVPMHLHRLSN